MTEDQRAAVLAARKARGLPWHSPPHLSIEGVNRFIISAACLSHQPIIGTTPKRMSTCEMNLLEVCSSTDSKLHAWCFLPAHYHLVLTTNDVGALLHAIGRFLGRCARQWNKEDNSLGRQVWSNCFERRLRGERHFWASINYVHHNPVKHGYAMKWQEWPYSSATRFLDEIGRERASTIWRKFPVDKYGDKWDIG